ncbi:hypothetical protein EIP86_010525 [Pleurotus ostreatoroseus]|nr:hypothetical protein EIP86_010525 [Pleurotus ostreatoroseus]
MSLATTLKTFLLPPRVLPQLSLVRSISRFPNTRVGLKSPVSAFPTPSRSRTRLVRPSNFPISPLPHSMTAEKSKVLIFGAGNFGSCLADHLGDSAHDVWLWSRIPEQVEFFNKHHRNPDVLQDHVFPDCIKAIGPEFPSEEVVQKADVLLFAIPTQGVRETLTLLKPTLNYEKLPLFIFVNKGIEIGSHALTLDIIADTCGPTVAKVATFIFTYARAGSYTLEDPIGVELAGALKNVYAIASGIAEGLGFENNTRASKSMTLGKGEKLNHIIDTLGSVAEGVTTAKGLKEILDGLGITVSAPIATAVYEVLYENADVMDKAKSLMSLPAIKELDLPEAGRPARLLMKKLGLSA